ncbi:uncharacterized protein LY89DRAFT_688276 [Mollisia scopiformis]|uniref:F-box domain-containing protein n=1 Tax=Mollisia scopiformis TaxID=149040 RepID=A0A194WXE1_MOLSC|nr:uncharacterized protein LY89DRAFT_688276 [Mollisia scopiformis]KUJ12648.1 hypothetical protein LY89DRAFT_688276 [Mollisia scopiformis]
MEITNAQAYFITPPSSLSNLPSELLLHILSYLDIPDLLNLSRTSHLFRQLSLDPLLHSFRLHRASFTIERSLPLRPPLATLMAHRIYITRTTLAARNLGRNLIKIKLNRQLLKRPSAEELVELGVLPAECFRRGGGLAPGLVETKRKIEKERIKDLLRGWVEEWRRRGDENLRGKGDEQKPDVRRIARRFARESSGGLRETPRWGRRVDVKEAPTRAKVLGLRRFWEKVGRDGSVSAG